MTVFQDGLLVLAASLFTAVLSEGLSWVMLYRTETYKRRKDAIDRLQKKIDKAKEKAAPATSGKKKTSGDEMELARLQQEFARSNMLSMLVLSVSYFFIFSTVSSHFGSKRVARLPFEPISLFQGISHRNLEGNDMTDCSFTFLYILGSIAFRTNVQKLFGTTPAKNSMPSMWDLASQQQQKGGKW